MKYVLSRSVAGSESDVSSKSASGPRISEPVSIRRRQRFTTATVDGVTATTMSMTMTMTVTTRLMTPEPIMMTTMTRMSDDDDDDDEDDGGGVDDDDGGWRR